MTAAAFCCLVGLGRSHAGTPPACYRPHPGYRSQSLNTTQLTQRKQEINKVKSSHNRNLPVFSSLRLQKIFFFCKSESIYCTINNSMKKKILILLLLRIVLKPILKFLQMNMLNLYCKKAHQYRSSPVCRHIPGTIGHIRGIINK
jgi:hypothetical protein